MDAGPWVYYYKLIYEPLAQVSSKGTDIKKKSLKKVEKQFIPIITLNVTMETSGRIWPNFKLIQALIYLIITCKYEKDLNKNKREKMETSIFPLYAYGDFFKRSRAANPAVSGLIKPKFELVRALMHVTCKFEKEWMKNSREKVETSCFFHHNPICYHGNH